MSCSVHSEEGVDKMTEAVSTAISQLNDHLGASGKTQSAVSKEIGISPGTLSQFLSGTYIGANEEIALKVTQYLEREHERSINTSPPTFKSELRNTVLVYSCLRYIQTRGGIGTIVGAAGSGKTTALKHYALDHSNVIYVQMDATKNSPRSVLKQIASALGKESRSRTSSDLLDDLVNELTGTNKLVVIDEAQHLTERSFDTVRALTDKAGIGIVYAGTPDIRNRMVGRKKEELDQVYSRIAFNVPLSNRYKLEEIRVLFDEYQLDDNIIKALYHISSRKGGLRLAINLFILAKDLARESGHDFSIDHLNLASKHIGTGDGIGAEE